MLPVCFVHFIFLFFYFNAKTIDYYQYMQDLWMGSNRAGLMQECEESCSHPHMFLLLGEKHWICIALV